MKIEFFKMHGAGNDYVYIDCFKTPPPNPEELARVVSPRHFSIGSDGLILVLPSDVADGRMRMFNADGSEGKMCGNGIRCVGKLLFDLGYVKKSEITVETASGVKGLKLLIDGERRIGASVDMGRASFKKTDIPFVSEGDATIYTSPAGFEFTCLSMGNPHAVTFVKGVESLDIESPGKALQISPAFPQGANAEFCELLPPEQPASPPDSIRMRVWERGSGETMACGTGACACVAAGIKNGLLSHGKEYKVVLNGGTLYIKADSDYNMTMTGDAKLVYRGIFDYVDEN
ncbi:MAG: diaminopimelate epimerase [Eubacteriales bacterium]